MKEFFIQKESGTYAEALEAYGFADLLIAIFRNQTILTQGNEVKIYDCGAYFEVESQKVVTPEIVDGLDYFQVIKFIKKKETDKVPQNIGNNFYNYPLQRDLRRAKKAEIEKVVKEFKGKEYTVQRKLINDKYQSERVEQPLLFEYDVFAQLASANNYTAFSKLYNNFNVNKDYFKILIQEILNFYSSDKIENLEFEKLVKSKKINIDNSITMLSLTNPNKGKGLNKSKATGLSTTNISGNWISETMKVSGALNYGMICQAVKVGSSYDMKVFVPAFHDTKLTQKQKVLESFKKVAKSNTPIKLDIINTLKIIELYLTKSTERERGKLKDYLIGLHSVYQKDLGQNKAVSNIGFLQTPNFIDLVDKEDWLEIIDEQQRILNGITEQGDAMIGLLAYRNFLNGSNINEYFKFNYWYAPYLMHELGKKQTYVRTNKIPTLNKLFTLMDISFKEIIENEGFQSVASAIRKSTVSLQYTPKGDRKFDVQYGIAQKLQNKSNSKEDLIAFVGEFVAKYNSDTARQFEKTKIAYRANVKDKELFDFFGLADKVNSKVLGAMLAAYGFALNKKEKQEDELPEDDSNDDSEEN
ncbi:MAG: hypothetical protein ACI91R_001354 [Vicingaceae bacterium]|jgi:hypothetical protein